MDRVKNLLIKLYILIKKIVIIIIKLIKVLYVFILRATFKFKFIFNKRKSLGYIKKLIQKQRSIYVTSGFDISFKKSYLKKIRRQYLNLLKSKLPDGKIYCMDDLKEKLSVLSDESFLLDCDIPENIAFEQYSKEYDVSENTNPSDIYSWYCKWIEDGYREQLVTKYFVNNFTSDIPIQNVELFDCTDKISKQKFIFKVLYSKSNDQFVVFLDVPITGEKSIVHRISKSNIDPIDVIKDKDLLIEELNKLNPNAGIELAVMCFIPFVTHPYSFAYDLGCYGNLKEKLSTHISKSPISYGEKYNLVRRFY